MKGGNRLLKSAAKKAEIPLEWEKPEPVGTARGDVGCHL